MARKTGAQGAKRARRSATPRPAAAGSPERHAGRPAGPRASARRRTEERLLAATLQAVARHGLAKLAMADVSAYAGVSKGTAYRYFPDTEAVLRALGRREAERFERQVWEAIERAPRGEERLRVALDYVERLGREHPLIQRLPETDPGVVLTSLRERFADIRDAFQRLFGPLLEDTALVRSGLVRADQLAGWTARMLISLFLFPEPESDRTTEDMRTVYRMMAGSSANAPKTPRAEETAERQEVERAGRDPSDLPELPGARPGRGRGAR
jgi:AcrR family transcriptional regulator